MKTSSMDDMLEIVGSNHKYQITIVTLLVLIGISCELAFIGVPVMETSPIITYKDYKGVLHKQLINYSLCNVNYTIVRSESKSSWVLDYDMFCSKFEISLLGSILCIGGIIGSAFLQYLKLKGPMFSVFFSCMILSFSSLLLLSHNIVFLYIANFFAGISNIMCFMLRINVMTEITGPKYRSYYNNIVLSSGIFATLLIYFLFDHKVNWRYIYFGNAILVFISAVLFKLLTVENFRFYNSNKDYRNMIDSLRYINNYNSESSNSESNLKLEEEILKLKILDKLARKKDDNLNNNLNNNLNSSNSNIESNDLEENDTFFVKNTTES